jgi:cyclopropane fatty-acyl-phospholipid synthase-like methyltransferase
MSKLQRWEARYAGPDFRFGTEPNAFLKSQTHQLKAGQTALCVADGEGRNGVWLAEHGLDVLSIDFVPHALEKAQALAARRGVKIRTELADVTTWHWPTAAFDVVVGIFIQFAGPSLRKKMFEGMKKALKPGGLLLLQGYRPEQRQNRTGGPDKEEKFYTRALLANAFGDFVSVEIREHDSVISEGTGHVGMSALIDLIARK